MLLLLLPDERHRHVHARVHLLGVDATCTPRRPLERL